ncbi:TRAP transporter small permease [Brachyspira alvinipulli]|uniref:TRAP transporter small permease n=1 Tax=Brachyspira alvinipulli TaxID=84379 RepID=UPI0004B13967|nr:TRAP transporter small permease subunit [Brachyspira alvinipulli]
MSVLEQIKYKIDKFLFYVLFIIVAAMLFCVSLQVFSRYLLRAPVVFTEELVRFLLIWLGLLGGAYTFGVKGHIALTLVLDKLDNINIPNIKTYINILIDVIVLFLAVFVLIIGGTKLISVTHNQVSSVMLIPMWCIYIVTPISGLIITFYQIYYIYKNILNIREAK